MEIYKTIKERNEEKAEIAVKKHVAAVRETIKENYHYLF